MYRKLKKKFDPKDIAEAMEQQDSASEETCGRCGSRKREIGSDYCGPCSSQKSRGRSGDPKFHDDDLMPHERKKKETD
jgi:transposase